MAGLGRGDPAAHNAARADRRAERSQRRESVSRDILTFSRREFVAALAGGPLLACITRNQASGAGRLSARPGEPTGTVTPGITRLGGAGADAFLYVPRSYHADTLTPLVLGLHGAGMHYSSQFDLLGQHAESRGFLVVSVQSSDYTWDGILGRVGPDVRRINTVLGEAFSRCRVDPARVIIEGFSDGASYALGLGLANGALFSRIVAFSPGFVAEIDADRDGSPEIFISHGKRDQILPIARTSRLIVPVVQKAGYQVTYEEFEGGHGVPPATLQTAVEWMMR
jgi:phospholipase/carboxylesterase